MKSIRWSLHHAYSCGFGFRSLCGRVQFRQWAVRGQVTQLALYDLWRVLAQIMRNSLNTNFDSTRGFSGVEISEFKVKRSRRLHDLLRWSVGRLIHAALVAGKPHHARNPGASCRNLGAPHDLVGVAAEGRRPHIRDVKWTLDAPDFQICF